MEVQNGEYNKRLSVPTVVPLEFVLYFSLHVHRVWKD